MSLTGSLSNALSGLSASSRAAEIVSSNVANATTEGYATRALSVSSASLGGNGAGVRVDGAVRLVDEMLIADRRAADAEVAQDSFVANYYATMEVAIGLPGEAGSIDSALVNFEGALVDAASRPEEKARLDAVVTAAVSLTETLNSVSDAVQLERQDADREILRQVEKLNTTLSNLEDLNQEISKQLSAGRDALGLMDERQALIDQVSSIVPVTVLDRDNGQVAIISSGGAVLLDGKAAQFEFSATNTITPDMTVQSGALSQVTLNGTPIDLSRETNMLQGGSLDALFAIRDEFAVETQTSIDALAAELVSRFEDASVDPSLSAGDAGLFTDAGLPYDSSSELGLAQRISVNTSVDPSQGGESWRIRDGLGAIVEGNSGQSQQLLSYLDVLSESRAPASSSLTGSERSLFSVASSVLSEVGVAKQQAEDQLTTSSTKWEALRIAELENGVDTDAEMQKLLLIEQAYAANAKVIEAIEEMLDTLTRI